MSRSGQLPGASDISGIASRVLAAAGGILSGAVGAAIFFGQRAIDHRARTEVTFATRGPPPARSPQYRPGSAG